MALDSVSPLIKLMGLKKSFFQPVLKVVAHCTEASGQIQFGLRFGGLACRPVLYGCWLGVLFAGVAAGNVIKQVGRCRRNR